MRVCGEPSEGRAGPVPRAAGRARVPPCLWLFLALALPLPVPAEPVASEGPAFELPVADVRLVEAVYRLDAVARLRLTPDVEEALHNGVDLTIAWEAVIERARRWWPDTDVAFITQRYRLSLHELSGQYIVDNRNTGERRSYTSLEIALDQIGTLLDFPLVDRVLVADGGDLLGRVRVRLEQDELPLPIRVIAMFDGDWDLATEWHQWRFE